MAGFWDKHDPSGVKRKIVFSNTGAEVAAIAAAPLGLLFFKRFTPDQMGSVEKFIRNTVVAPYLETIESTFDRFTPAPTKQEVLEERKGLSLDERAGKISKTLTDFGVSAVASGAVGLAAKKIFDKMYALDTGNKDLVMSWVWDEGVKIGAMLLIPTLFSKPSEAVKGTISRILTKSGMQEEAAKDASMTLVNVGLPDLLGLAASIQYLFKNDGSGGRSR